MLDRLPAPGEGARLWGLGHHISPVTDWDHVDLTQFTMVRNSEWWTGVEATF